jgi:UDP-N-acetylglucosamine 2-epimerase (non-hydrolysing)
VIAKRLKVPVYHMEAGNRCFDENVPEETNRRLVDHVADYNLVYTEHARRNLIGEGIHPSRIVLTGSPMREVLEVNAEMISSSDVLEREGLTAGKYFLVSLHREENVDNAQRLTSVLSAMNELVEIYRLPILVSTHPRTLKQLATQPDELKAHLTFHTPFGFNDYVRLQKDAKLVLSDSGTISEESSILGFPAVTLRDSIERPEAIDAGAIITVGVNADSILAGCAAVLAGGSLTQFETPAEYRISDTSSRVLKFILSTAWTHKLRAGIR